MEYTYVKLVKDTHGLERICLDAERIRAKAFEQAEIAAKGGTGCDCLLRNNRHELFIGFKEKPKGDWFKKGKISKHDGYYVVIPKVRSEQGKQLKSAQLHYSEEINDCKSTTNIVMGFYPEFPQKIIDASSANSRGGMAICGSVFGLIKTAQNVIVGKVPFDFKNGHEPFIPSDFKEITASQFNSYFK